MRFKTKLYAGFGSILALIVILLFILLNILNQFNQSMQQVVKERYEMVRLANIVGDELNIYSRESRGLAANPPAELIPELIENRDTSLSNAYVALSALEKLDTGDKSQELIQKLKLLSQTYMEKRTNNDVLVKSIKEGKTVPTLWYGAREVREQMLDIIGELRVEQERGMEEALNQSHNTYELAVKAISLYVAVWLLIGIGVSVWLIRSISRNLNKVTSVMTSVTFEETDKLPRIEMDVKDEIGDIAEAFNAMATTLEKHAHHEKELTEAAKQQSWLKTNVAEIATMYAGVQDLSTLSRLFISKITPLVGANYGVFYIKEGNQPYLQKLAAYADPKQAIGAGSFQLGEGLVGQCAQDNRTIELNKVPEEYIPITSGVGKATPAAILILPAEYEGEVLAVIELASFEAFCPLQRMLLQEVMDSIGITIHSIMNHMKVEKLLQESQSLTEELQTQSEELQMQQEELRTINEELEEQYEQSQLKSKELDKIRIALEDKAKQLVQSSQYKSEFLANMSHELRTPLNSLLILAQMLAQNVENNLTAKQVEFAQTIYSSGNDLLLLINDILDLAKVESGKMDIYPEKVELSEVQLFVENQFSHLAQQKGIAFSVQISPELPEIIFTDKHRLLQILKNLLSNAFKFTKLGHIHLNIRKVDHPSNRTADQNGETSIAFAVSDTGIGIPQEMQSMIFEAFKQANGSTSRQYGGTGLGLSISRELAHLLGGTIEIESREGIGSTFTLYLPYRDRTRETLELTSFEKEAAVSLAAEEDSPPSLGISPRLSRESLLEGKKVLIVDDDMRNIFALTTAFEGFQMDVIFAENGKDGLKLLQENPDIDLILMDIMMPEMDGYEAMRAIRQLPEFQEMPIIALTAKAMKQDREQCIDAGASDYISKPINLEQLLSLMRVWLYK